MESSETLVVFLLDGQRFALAVEHVQRVLAAVEVTPLPGAPSHVCGVIDLHGDVTPVLDLRRRAADGLPRAIAINDRFIVLRTARRTVALVADEALGVIEVERALLAVLPATPGAQARFRGATQQDDGLVLVHDVDQFLDAHEADALERALEELA
jgi:purine-binding chemotaxis protein CheW